MLTRGTVEPVDARGRPLPPRPPPTFRAIGLEPAGIAAVSRDTRGAAEGARMGHP